MDRFRWAAPLALLAVLVACDDTSSPLPRQAASLTHLDGIQACDATLASQIYAEIDQIFSGAQRSKSRKLFGDVESTCSTNLTLAQNNMMEYVKYTISQKSKVNTTVQALADNWDKAFVYVGFAPPSDALPSGATLGLALTSEGAAGVFSSGLLQTGTKWGALYAATGYPRQRLWTIVPITCPAHLGLEPLCFDFAVHPFDGTNSQIVTAGFCPLNHTDAAHNRLEAAHEDQTFSTLTKIPKRGATSLLGLACSTAPTEAMADGLDWWQFASNRSFLDNALSAVGDFLSPAPAYALHGGLSGSTDTRSTSLCCTPWGAVDPLIFADDFENDTPGQPPFRPDVGEIPVDSTLPTPWFISLTSPSSVTVQSNYADFTSKAMVVDQKGGNSANSDSLVLSARVRGNAPDKGRVSIRWQAATGSPNVSSAPVFIRSYDGTQIVARVDFAAGATAQSGPIKLNGVATGITWNRNVSLYFEVIVDLDTDALTFRANTGNWSTSGTPISTTVFDAGVANVGRFGVEMGGQDNGLIGLDKITITRLPEAP